MFALLGDVQFDLITYFDGFESQFGADYAEHPLIEGKPRLQFVGDKLDEIRIQLAFHLHYCDPEAELAKLKDAERYFKDATRIPPRFSRSILQQQGLILHALKVVKPASAEIGRAHV